MQHLVDAAKAVHAPPWLQWVWVAFVTGSCLIGVGYVVWRGLSADDWVDLMDAKPKRPRKR